MKKGRADLRNAVRTAEQNAMEMLVALFDWLDGLEPQPTTEITKTKITNGRALMDQAEARHSAVSCSSCLHPALETYPMENRT